MVSRPAGCAEAHAASGDAKKRKVYAGRRRFRDALDRPMASGASGNISALLIALDTGRKLSNPRLMHNHIQLGLADTKAASGVALCTYNAQRSAVGNQTLIESD